MPRRPDLPRPEDDTAGQRVVPEFRLAGRHAAEDQLGLADSRGRRPAQDLRDRLRHLPEWHPSSLAPDCSTRSASTDKTRLADRVQVRPERLNDTEHADRVRHIRTQLADGRNRGLVTEDRFFNRSENRWTIERQLVHREIVDELYTEAARVPCDRKAVMAGGLGGAGKSTASYKAGELTISQLAERFRNRRWPSMSASPRPTSYMEMAAQAQEDPVSDVPGSFDDVEAAFFRHELSREEYEVLRAAIAEGSQSEDQNET